MHCDAIIFDLDGTAVPNAGKRPSETMIAAVKKYQSELVLCAATGRSWSEAEPVIQALGLQKPVILSGGTVIADPLAVKIIWQSTLPLASAQAIMDVAQPFPYVILHARGLQAYGRIEPGQQYDADDKTNIFYVLDVPTEHEDFKLLMRALRKIDGVNVTTALSWTRADAVDIHITHIEATKEHAVVELCDMLHLERSRVAGVGDGHNDLHLFNAVGYKVAMGNAVSELKEAADVVIGNVDEDGLALFIEEAACHY